MMLARPQERGEYLEKQVAGVFGTSWTRYFFIILGEQQVLRRTKGEADTRGSLLYYSSEEVSGRNAACSSLAARARV